MSFTLDQSKDENLEYTVGFYKCFNFTPSANFSLQSIQEKMPAPLQVSFTSSVNFQTRRLTNVWLKMLTYQIPLRKKSRLWDPSPVTPAPFTACRFTTDCCTRVQATTRLGPTVSWCSITTLNRLFRFKPFVKINKNVPVFPDQRVRRHLLRSHQQNQLPAGVVGSVHTGPPLHWIQRRDHPLLQHNGTA